MNWMSMESLERLGHVLLSITFLDCRSMSDAMLLPSKLDLAAAMHLVSELRKVDGDYNIDASKVTHMGALCLQALIAAAQSAKSTGRQFEMTGASDKVLAQMNLMGTSPETLMECV